MIKFLSLFAFFIVIYVSCFGQDLNFASKKISISQGLSHNTVECIFKDSEGFVWFGTHNGLNRFDGLHIRTFQHIPSDSNSLSGERILCINEDQEGNLWIGTSGNGLNKFNRITETFCSYKTSSSKSSLPANRVTAIEIFSDNSVWIGTSNGLAKYNPKTKDFVNYNFKGLEKKNVPFFVTDILETQNGSVYVASNHNYLLKFNKEQGSFQKISYARNTKLISNLGKKIVEDDHGNIWISAFSHGLVKLNPESDESQIFTSYNSNLATDLLDGDLVYKNNRLWLATDGLGIVIFDLSNETFLNLKKNKNDNRGLFSNSVYCLFIDDQNIVWVGSFDEGVSVLDPNQLKFTQSVYDNACPVSFDDVSVLSIFEDSKQNMWIGTDGNGLYKIESSGKVILYQHNSHDSLSLSSNRVVCINENSDGLIYLGTFTGGMEVLNPKTHQFTHYMPDENNNSSIASTHVWDVFIDSESRYWIGMLGPGLDLFDPANSKFIHYGQYSKNYNRINHDNVMSIIEDWDGDIWFATEGKGINILDKESGQMFYSISSNKQNSLSSLNIKCLFQDSKGLIWIGTVNGGLMCYNKQTQEFEYYNKNNGLPSNIIYSIIEDNNHCLWLGTANGLSCFNLKSKAFQNYDSDDGLNGLICNRKALLQSSDGYIWVGTTKGLTVFNPANITKSNFGSEVLLTGLKIQNKQIIVGDSINGRIVLTKSLNHTESLTIYPEDRTFTLMFGVNNFTLPHKCQFKYKLKGFDDDWQLIMGNNPEASFSNLKPGNYKFQVFASNSDGVWGNKITSIPVKVLPSFLQSIWFKLILGSIILLLIYIGVWYRLKLSEKEYLKEKSIQDKRIVELEKEKLETELNSQTFGTIQRNRSLLKQKRRLGTLLNRVDEKSKETLIEIIDDINQEVNQEKDWKQIEPRLDKVYNNFMSELKEKHSDLTQNELRIVAYIRMGLSTKEIAELMQKTIKAIDNDRYRLRKKLNIAQNNSLKNYLLNI